MMFFNIFTNLIFISFIVITSKSLNNAEYYGLLSYAIVQTVLRSMMNIFGIITSKILSKNVLKRNNNALFLFGIASVTFTVLFDIVFIVYFNCILFYIKTKDIVIGLGFMNILWIIDIIMVCYD